MNYRKASITPRQMSMLNFAMTVSQDAQEIQDDDIAALTTHGFTLEDVWDITAIASFFAMSNRLADVTSMQPIPNSTSLAASSARQHR